MAVEVFMLMMKDTESVLTAEEARDVWVEAVRQEWAIDNGGVFSLTEAGRRLIEASHK
jgi:hypothetical protein